MSEGKSNVKFPMRQGAVQLFGRLTRTPELKFNKEQKATLGFSLAVERWNGQERVTWFANCRMFGAAAERFVKVARQGMPVYVTGEPYMEKWETREGEKRDAFKVLVASADALVWPESGDGEAGTAGGGGEDDIPF